MKIKEVWINQTKDYSYGDSGYYEPFTDDKRKLFKALSKEYGRCASKVYVDTKEGTKAVGWVFEKSMKYTDCNKKYIQETWVTLYEDDPETVTRDYHYIGLD